MTSIFETQFGQYSWVIESFPKYLSYLPVVIVFTLRTKSGDHDESPKEGTLSNAFVGLL